MTEITDLTAVLESPLSPHLEMEVPKRQSDQSFQSLPFKTAVILGLLLFQTAVIFMEKMWVGDDFRGVGGWGFQNDSQISNFSNFPLKRQSFWASSLPNGNDFQSGGG